MVAVRGVSGATDVLEVGGEGDAAERDLIRRLVARIRAEDPDVIENHNLHGFDLPFLDRRARILGVPLALGRAGPPGLRRRAARRGTDAGTAAGGRVRFMAPGRELIDTLDAVLRYDFATRELPGHGLKAVARHLGLAGPDRELIRGDQVYEVFRRDPERVRRYAAADVEEVAALARLLGGAAFALARMAPRRYERLADAGAATGVIDPLLVRAYLRAGMALPAHQAGDGTPHSGAALHLFATGVAHRIVKADVASLYPSLMRAYRIGPARDHLGAMLALVDRLVDRRLAAKASGRAAPPGSAERYAHEAMSAAMKLVVNSAYGYLAAGGGLTRFADVHAANEVTRRGRETLGLICRELAARGVTLLEADTDGVYFAVPEGWAEADERRVVAEVAALLPPLVPARVRGTLRRDALARAEELRAARLRRRAAPARCGVSLEPRGAVRRGVPAPRHPPPAGRRRRRRARGVPRDRRGARPAGAADARRVVARAADEGAGRVPRDARASARSAVRGDAGERSPDVERRRPRPRLPDERRAASASSSSRTATTTRKAATAATTTWTTTCTCCATRSRPGSRARSLRRDFAAVFADPDQRSLFDQSLAEVRTVLTHGRRPAGLRSVSATSSSAGERPKRSIIISCVLGASMAPPWSACQRRVFMRARVGILVMVLGLAVTMVGCGSAPTADIDAAKAAIAAAGTAGAADYAAASLKAAEDAQAALDAELKAQEGKMFKSYDKAKELAVDAKAAGEKAAADAAAGKEKAKADATQAIADAKTALTEAEGLLDEGAEGEGLGGRHRRHEDRPGHRGDHDRRGRDGARQREVPRRQGEGGVGQERGHDGEDGRRRGHGRQEEVARPATRCRA